MYTILLVEDNPHIMKINSQMLEMRGYRVLQAPTAQACRQKLYWEPVDLVVLDILLPDGSGLDLCREIKEKYRIPILMLSALGENRDIVEGLRSGGDDYLAKPYDLEVLAAHIEARLREKEEKSRYVCYGPLRMDLVSGRGDLEDRELLLSSREFSLLLLLARRGGSVVPTLELVREIWDDDSEVSVRALWTLLSRVRKKLKDSRLEISSVRGTGYMLEQI